ncbi:MAG: hypothetical protein ACYTBW_02655 [Planctomycetota bacterium]|jgi:hypothetical protein
MELLDLQINEGGMVTLRTHLRSLIEDNYANLEKIDQREWGNMKIAFFHLLSETESRQSWSGCSNRG